MKAALREQRLSNDHDVKEVIFTWLLKQPEIFYEADVHASIQKSNIAIEEEELK